MSGETDREVSGWTVDTLKEHLERKIDEVDLRHKELLRGEHELRLARREDDLRAIDKAEAAMNKRLDSMNELRDQLNHQATTFISHEVHRADVEKLQALIERNRQDIEAAKAALLPRETFEQATAEWQGWRSGVNDWMSSSMGRQEGVKASFGSVAALIAAVGTLIAIVVVLANVLTT